MSRVLVVDDEPQIRRTLAINLRARGYQVDLAASGEEALKVAADLRPDVVVLDLGLPGIDGLQVIHGLRGWTQVPIIVLSVREREADKVAALDAGADDYVTKPFGINELLARLRAAVRRATPTDEQTPVVQTPDFRVDLTAKQVTRSGREIRLTPPNGSWSSSSSANPAGWSASGTSSRRSGASTTARRPTTFASSSPRSAASSNRTRRTLATSSPNPAWATASRSRSNHGRLTNQGRRKALSSCRRQVTRRFRPPSCWLCQCRCQSTSHHQTALQRSRWIGHLT